MAADLTLKMPDGATIVVPDDLLVNSSYVLQEQLDWFEDEIRFLRVALQPGLRAIDVGANFGVYTLALAQRGGEAGRVWAIEPGEEAAAYLHRSIEANCYAHVDLVRCALSAADGSGFLQSGITPELRRLVPDDASAAVGVRALDSLATERRMDHIDFIKIDVEGEECNVLEGAAAFLACESPLLMIEFWSDKKFNDEIFAPLRRHGYDCFRLVPGINVLAPFYESEEPDPYQLNLFACKPARAAQLAATGFLVSTPATKAPEFAHEPALDYLLDRPFAAGCSAAWRKQAEQARSGSATADHLQALRWFYAAHNQANSATARVWAIEHAYLQLRALIRTEFTAGRAASFVRIAAAYGQRAEAIDAARRLVKLIPSSGTEAFAEPFLLPWPHQETLDPGADLRGLLLASAIESYERLFQFSSSDKQSLAQESLAARVDAGFLSADYLRRETLFKRRASALATVRA